MVPQPFGQPSDVNPDSPGPKPAEVDIWKSFLKEFHSTEKATSGGGRERRVARRWPYHAGCSVALNGRMAKLLDVSATGARVASRTPYEIGASTVLDLPWGKKVRGSVVGAGDGGVRLRFDYEIDEPF